VRLSGVKDLKFILVLMPFYECELLADVLDKFGGVKLNDEIFNACYILCLFSSFVFISLLLDNAKFFEA
jgi:hypothetical protein